MPTARAKRLVITGGEGAWLTTSTGQRLLDATASLWHANIGHGRERIARAAYDQMRKLETYHTFGRFANEPALRLADRLVALGPIRGAKVMLTSGGSDSVDLACKLARRHWQLEGRGQKKVILSRAPRLPRAARLRHQHRRSRSTTGTATAPSLWSRRPPGSPPTTSTRSAPSSSRSARTTSRRSSPSR